MRTDRSAPRTIDEYIAGFPRGVRETLKKIRATIRRAAPAAEETIKYQMPTYTLKGTLVSFAAWREHVGLYPSPSTGDKKFKDELSVYKGAKSSLRFPIDKPIPFDLIGKVVKLRVRENLDRAASRQKRK
jgi:uncharacterized protein YdhG (YjbR/CyaY superfamily)